MRIKADGFLFLRITVSILGFQTTPRPKNSLFKTTLNNFLSDKVISFVAHLSSKIAASGKNCEIEGITKFIQMSFRF